MELVLPPYVVLLLSVLVSIRWLIKFFYHFEWTTLGSLAPRLLITVVYTLSTFIPQDAEVLRPMVRIGIALLFFDELLNWWRISRVESKTKKKLRAILHKSSSLLEEINGIQ